MNISTNKPTAYSLQQNPAPEPMRSQTTTDDAPLKLPELEAHVRLIQANFEFLSQFSEFAKKTIFSEIAAKLKELTGKEARAAEIDVKEKMLNEMELKVNSNQKQLTEERNTFQTECIKQRQTILEERVSKLQRTIQYALPKFLTTEDSRTAVKRLQLAMDSGSEGKQLQIFLGLVAVAEDTKDSQLYITALTKLFPLLRDLDTISGGSGGGFIYDITALINKGNEFGFEVRAPKKGDLVTDWMNAPIGVKSVNEVFCWAIINKEKAVIRKAEVK